MTIHRRPNVRPAKYVPPAEKLANGLLNHEPDYKLGSGRFRGVRQVVDVCDHCKKFAAIRKQFLFLRKYGWTVNHPCCYKKLHGNDSPKEHKVIIGLNNRTYAST